MVLLSTIKQVLSPEQPFEKGHPIQLLLYLFNQFNQESVLLLLNQIETILPPISKQCTDLTRRADTIFEEAFQTHQQYENASAEQKEMIEEEIRERTKTKSKAKAEATDHEHDTKQTELDDIELESDARATSDGTQEWMETEQFRLCDLYFRKASKLSPKCIKCRLKHLKFLMRCKKASLAEEIYQKTLSIIRGHKKKKKKAWKERMDAAQIENLITFYYAYLHYMEDDLESFERMLRKCLEQEPNNIGMRCQYVVCLTTAQEYEKGYVHLIETLKLLQTEEKKYVGMATQKKKEKEKETRFGDMDRIKHYRVVCGIGCAAIRCVFGVDWNIVTQHLQFVIANDDSNVGVLKYCLSYALYRDGAYEESNQFYHEFVAYIENKKTEAQIRKTKREFENRNNDKTEQEMKEEAIKDAASELTMDFFKWTPAEPKDNAAEILDLVLDIAAISILIVITYSIAGYTPHMGNGIVDWLVIAVMLIISCALVTPSLGLLLMAVTLPPYHQNMAQQDFNYFAFGTRWLCVSAGLLFVYRVVIGGKVPTQRLF